jgi:energy-coupling factor transport system permease protein
MLRDITIGQYYPVDSMIHRLDPRVKLIGCFIFIMSLFMVTDMKSYAVVVGATLLLTKVSKVPIAYMTKGLKPVMMVIVFAFMLNIFMTSGTPIISVGSLSVTYEGLYIAVFMALRLIILIFGTSLLTLTTSPIQLTDGLEKMLKPFERIGMPAHELAMMMTIALRFIPTLLEETDKIMKAQMARGADFETGGLLKRAKSLVPLLVPLFVSAFRRADELAMAMEARCYRGGENRTKLKVLKYSKTDFKAIAISTMYVAAVILFDIYARRH